MKRLFLLLSFVLIGSALCGQTVHNSKFAVKKGRIVFDTPKRAPNQQSMLGFAAEPIPVVRVGIIGLGMRGPGAVTRLGFIDNVEIRALCDLYPERIEENQQILEKAGMPRADEYSGEEGWKQLCERDDLDLVYIVTPWLQHVPMAVYAMEHGKHVALEVPAAQSVAECWQLVDTSERTRRHCMMVENCVYDFFELTTLNMAQQGLFGEIIHAQGGYVHCLEQYWSSYQGDWRFDFNKRHTGDIYATHGLGPICQALNIHRGDKMNTLVSVSTGSFNGRKLSGKRDGDRTFRNGDQTSTLITTERGKTILLQHNVMTPRPYDRLYQLVGTDGYASKYPVEGYAFGDPDFAGDERPDIEALDTHGFVSEARKAELMRQYEHPIQRQLTEKAKEVGGHGGMDFIMDYRLIHCLQKGLPLDQDVYDAAEWSCIGELSAKSIEHGNAPVEVPDFTRGEWNRLPGLVFAE